MVAFSPFRIRRELWLLLQDSPASTQRNLLGYDSPQPRGWRHLLGEGWKQSPAGRCSNLTNEAWSLAYQVPGLATCRCPCVLYRRVPSVPLDSLSPHLLLPARFGPASNFQQWEGTRRNVKGWSAAGGIAGVQTPAFVERFSTAMSAGGSSSCRRSSGSGLRWPTVVSQKPRMRL